MNMLFGSMFGAESAQTSPPTSGTQVFYANTTYSAASPNFSCPFAPDLLIRQFNRSYNGGPDSAFIDRVRGDGKYLVASWTSGEGSYSGLRLLQNGVDMNVGVSPLAHMFKRAQGFLDIVVYDGTGAVSSVSHGLGVVPELILVFSRSGNNNLVLMDFGASNHANGILNTNAAISTSVAYGSTSYLTGIPTNTVIPFGTTNLVNAASTSYVMYLFASLAGISKIGSYTGNGTTLNVSCGFSAGARLLWIKNYSTGDWYIWDTTRGIIAGNDPHVSFNSTAAEVTTDDSISPYASGFSVNQNTATNINVSGQKYKFLAIS